MSGAALRVSHAKVIHPVAIFAPTDPVVFGGALRLHLQVLSADVAAVQTSRQVVPQLGVVLTSAGHALCGRGCGAVSFHMSSRRTLITSESFIGKRVVALIRGSAICRRSTKEGYREQEQHGQGELRRRQ